MKRIATVLCLIVPLVFPLGAHAQAMGQGGKAASKISAQLKNVPFKAAIDTLFGSTGYQYEVEPGVTNAPITVMLNGVDFDEALRLLIKQAGAVQPEVYMQKNNGRYLIGVREKTLRAVEPQLEKISIQFHNAVELLKELEKSGLAREFDSLEALPRDNSLLARGTPQQLQQLKNAIQLLDIPARMLSIRIGVTGPGAGGRPLQLASMTRTVNGREVIIDEQTTSGGEVARLRVQVRPTLQGDGGVLTESDWDLSLPVAGGPKGPIRLVKRLTTTARLRSGRSITVGEVDLAPYGGNGTVRLWLRADVIRDSDTAEVSTEAGETFSSVLVHSGKPYVSALWLAGTLGGQLRRSVGGQYEIRAGLPQDSERLPKTEMPTEPGPFRLLQGARVVSEHLQFAVSLSDDLRLVPDAGGDPLVPLEDVARLLGGRLTYDSAADSYRIVGGRRLSALRFPATAARDR